MNITQTIAILLAIVSVSTESTLSYSFSLPEQQMRDIAAEVNKNREIAKLLVHGKETTADISPMKVIEDIVEKVSKYAKRVAEFTWVKGSLASAELRRKNLDQFMMMRSQEFIGCFTRIVRNMQMVEKYKNAIISRYHHFHPDIESLPDQRLFDEIGEVASVIYNLITNYDFKLDKQKFEDKKLFNFNLSSTLSPVSQFLTKNFNDVYTPVPYFHDGPFNIIENSSSIINNFNIIIQYLDDISARMANEPENQDLGEVGPNMLTAIAITNLRTGLEESIKAALSIEEINKKIEEQQAKFHKEVVRFMESPNNAVLAEYNTLTEELIREIEALRNYQVPYEYEDEEANDFDQEDLVFKIQLAIEQTIQRFAEDFMRELEYNNVNWMSIEDIVYRISTFSLMNFMYSYMIDRKVEVDKFDISLYDSVNSKHLETAIIGGTCEVYTTFRVSDFLKGRDRNIIFSAIEEKSAYAPIYDLPFTKQKVSDKWQTTVSVAIPDYMAHHRISVLSTAGPFKTDRCVIILRGEDKIDIILVVSKGDENTVDLTEAHEYEGMTEDAALNRRII